MIKKKFNSIKIKLININNKFIYYNKKKNNKKMFF